MHTTSTYCGTLLLSVLLLACSGTDFEGNKDNPLMVGEWTIQEVDQSGALSSKEALALSMFEEHYEKGHVFHFAEGDQVALTNAAGDTLQKGRYGISGENKYLKLLSPGDDHVTTFAIEKKSENKFNLKNKTTGEFTNLTIERQK